MTEAVNLSTQANLAKQLYAPTHHDSAFVAKLYQSNADSMRARLPDLGESLHNAAIDLSHECTLERIDQLLLLLKGAETSLLHLRRAVIEEVMAGRD